MKKLIIILFIAVTFAACQNTQQGSGDAGSEKVSLTAAGATFPLPFYNLAFAKYSEATGVNLTYGGIGSGGGIRSLKDRVIDFGGSDAFLDDEQQAEMPAEVIHIPTCIGAVVVAFNLPGIESLNLSDALLEGIFLGNITQWNDPAIKAENSDVNLPDLAITVVYRSDGSGTTFIFSDYMTKVSKLWSQQVGAGKSLNWPVGIGAKGNPGVAGTIGQTEGAIGYIGSEFAFSQKISFAAIQNSSGSYVTPSMASISASANADIPADTRVMLTNSDDPQAYPISGFTWILLYKEQSYDNRSMAQAEATVTFLQWIIGSDAQAVAPTVHYAPLPETAVIRAKELLRSVTYDGKTLLK